jgi:hypothetical protein
MRYVLLIMSFAISGYAQSQQPVSDNSKAAAKPQNQAGHSQQEPAILKRGTNEAPLVVDVIEAPPNQEEAAKEEARAEAELSTNRWIMIFTGVLTVFTFGQIIHVWSDYTLSS